MRLALGTYPARTTAVDPRRVAVASAALFTSIAGETQMHHFDADRATMSCSRRLVGVLILSRGVASVLRGTGGPQRWLPRRSERNQTFQKRHLRESMPPAGSQRR